MLGADGDGGLALGLEIKQFERIGDPFESQEAAEKHAQLLCGETLIGPTADGKFILWIRK